MVILKRLVSGGNTRQVTFDFNLRLTKSSLIYINTLKQLFCTADFRSPVKDFSNLGVIDVLHDIDLFVSGYQEANLNKFVPLYR